MTRDFFKFPTTPHLFTLAGLSIRNDKVLSPAEREEFLQHQLIIEEKIDGANLGLSFDDQGNLRAQNRGAYLNLPESGQWKKLDLWLAPHTDSLFEHLSDRLILFGEWCYARHSVPYNRLTDLFLGFDIYDKQKKRFLSIERRDQLLTQMNLRAVPLYDKGHYSMDALNSLLTESTSRYGDQKAEGLYLRVEQNNWLVKRAKLVRPEFLQTIQQHWMHSRLQTNKLASTEGSA